MWLFKSPSRKAEEDKVDEAGRYLFEELDEARKSASRRELSEADFKNRINSPYVAGFFVGYCDVALRFFVKEPALLQKYTKRIVERTLGNGGMRLLATWAQYAVQNSPVDIQSPKVVFNAVTSYDTGFACGRVFASDWFLERKQRRNDLSHYLISGETDNGSEGDSLFGV